jgi:hypothetical protein
MSLPGPFAWELVVAAFAGGAFGAAIGGLPSFALTGLFVIVGEAYALLHRTTDLGAAPLDITGSIAFGPVLGPHVAFGGGAAAVAYAARRGYRDVDGRLYDPKDIGRGLGSRPDVLAVGGCFGVFGYLVAAGAETAALPTDPVALGVVLSAVGHRVTMGYDLIGSAPGRLLDMSPFEPTGGSAAERRTDGGTAVEPWLPYQYRWSHVAALGLVVGVLAAYVAYYTASPFLAFGLAALVLTFLAAGVAQVPVTHHMALPASTVVLLNVETSGPVTPGAVAGALPLSEALVLGAALGLLGALLGELTQRVFFAHAETHLDPPAVSIVLTTLLLGGLVLLGVFPSAAWIPLP